MAVDRGKFAEVTKLVIDNLEGGYWNPAYHGVPPGYESSGETMFGIDRKAGGDINYTPSGKKFWSLIDANKSPQVWKYNYIPPEPLKSQLKDLAVETIYPKYEDFSSRYLKPQTRQIVDNDGRLIFHMAYATWNGAGWFRKFANDLNAKVDSGVTNPDALAKVAIDSRTKEGLRPGSPPNKLIAKGGNKIESLSDKLKSLVSAGITKAKAGIKKAKENPFPTAIVTIVLVVGGYVLYNKLIDKI